MEFSKQVKLARQQLGFSQMQLALELGVSFSSINRWERGHTQPPDVIKKLFSDYCERHGVNFTVLNKNYILKHKDIAVLEIQINDVGAIASIGKVLNEQHLPVGTAKDKSIDHAAIKEWWKGRTIPASRAGLREMLDALDYYLPEQLMEKSFGLSLSDQYWICPVDTELKWSEVNFFHNDFSEDVGNLLFGNTDINDVNAVSLISPDNTSDGVLKKKWKIIEGQRCLIKGGTSPINQEIANEVLASRICQRLGIPFVEYNIACFDGEKYCVCRDFITGDTELVSAWHIKKLIKKDNRLSEYGSFIEKCQQLGIPDAQRHIDMMLTLDFIIVNTDRHYNNFGLVRDANTLRWLGVAPVYDSGTSMWCKELTEAIDAASSQIESKPFRSKHLKQIELVKDFSWLNLDALDGIENEFADILNQANPSSSLTARNKKLCLALRKRTELLRGIISARI
jgi:hypothetical protein